MAAWLALFALACQLVFSFGHVHVGKAGFGLLQAAAENTGTATDGSSPAKDPAGKNPAGLAGDFCAICANISLAGALILPILAAILLPVLSTEVWQRSWTACEPVAFRHQPFGARGPPLLA